MSITIKKNTVDISSSIDWSTIQLTSVLTKEVSTLQFLVRSTPSKSIPSVGDQIDMYEGAVHIFGGTVTEVTIDSSGLLLAYTIMCTDWSFKLNGKLVAKNYAAIDPGDIVRDIISTYTTGFTTTHVQSGGFNVATLSMNYEQVTQSIEKVARQIGWEWYVDPDKDLHFFPPSTLIPAPFIVDDTSGKLDWSTLEVDINLQNMKNSVYVIGGQYTKIFNASTTPDVYQTDGIRSIFPIAYTYERSGLGSNPDITVTLDGVTQVVGNINEVTVPASVDVLYSQGGKFIQFTTTPGSGHTVKVFGTANVPIIAHASDQQAIATYGEFQSNIHDRTIRSISEAHARANAEITQYGHAVYTVKFNTKQTGLIVGQTLTVNSTKFALNTTVVVKRITGTAYSPSQMIYAVECVGSDSVSFTDIMTTLLTQQNELNPADESSVLQVLQSFNENATISEVLVNPTHTSGPYKWGAGTNVGLWNKFTWG